MTIHVIPDNRSRVERAYDLDQMLALLDDHDNGVFVLTQEELDQLMEKIFRRVDETKMRLDTMADEAKRLREYAAEHEKAARQLESRQSKLEARIGEAMKTRGFEKMPGKQWRIILSSSEYTQIDQEACETSAALYPEYVRVSYSWDKLAIKKDLDAGTCALASASLKPRYKPSFQINKKG